MTNIFKLEKFHAPVSEFLKYAGKSNVELAEGYSNTQLDCFLEEAEEIIETFNKGLDNHPAHIYAIADDIADTHFSGIGFLYCIGYGLSEETIYEDYQDYLDLVNVDLSTWQPDSLVYIIKNEVRNIRGILGKKYDCNSVLEKRLVLSKYVSRILACTTVLGTILAVDAEKCLDIVCRANLAKFDMTLDDANKSVETYKAKGIKVEGLCVGQSVWAIVCSEEQTVDGKLYPDRKILKSHNWKEPEFPHLKHLLEI